MNKKTSGMLLGKFMPPHAGHIALARFAQSYVDDLTIVVGSLQSEPIDGKLRYQWMRDMFPNARVVHLTDENPQQPEDHPDFWTIWHDSLMRILPDRPDYVFAGEDYGAPLAKVLGARFIPANMGRSHIPVSATMIRQNPVQNWNYIASAARPYFLKRICLTGAESTGKSMLAKRLAAHFNTAYVPEYAYSYIKTYGKNLQPQDMHLIARGQIASEAALEKDARGLLICDTDVLTTSVWHEHLFGKMDETLDSLAGCYEYDLTLICGHEDTPFIHDIHRYEEAERTAFAGILEKKIEKSGRMICKLSGSWEQRFHHAVRIIEDLISGE